MPRKNNSPLYPLVRLHPTVKLALDKVSGDYECSKNALLDYLLREIDNMNLKLHDVALLESKKKYPTSGMAARLRWTAKEDAVKALINGSPKKLTVEQVAEKVEITKDQAWRMLTNLVVDNEIKEDDLMDFQKKP